MPAPTRVAIALGSNLGDRAAHLRFAAVHLGRIISNLQLSTVHETAPVGVAPQPSFLNAAATGNYSDNARALLDDLLTIEREAGRTRPHPGAPRTLDLDLVLFGDAIIAEQGLIVPHPRFRERAFVLAPLAEIAPDWKDPVTGSTVGELLATLEGQG